MESLLRLYGSDPIKLMLEVGSFVGDSASIWGRLVKESGGVLLCIDTWTADKLT